MKTLKPFFFLIAIFLLTLTNTVYSQTTVFSDDINSNVNANFTTTGQIGSSALSVTRSGDDWGARRYPDLLELSNDIGGTGNINGWVLAYTLTSSFSSPYNTTLSSNPGLITWTFNMRQVRTDPAGFSSGSYGVAFILAGSSASASNDGNGYAIVLGQSGTTDPIRLAKYNNGLQGTLTNIIISNITGFTDFGQEYLSIKVTYNPSNNQWELFIRKDGSSGFSDPTVGTLTSQGTANDNTYTGNSLTYLGAYWQGSTGMNQTAFFDNFKVTVVAPSHTITTGTISGSPFCVTGTSGTIVSVPFTKTGTFTTGNIFTAQLSDATGSFTSYTNIGTLTSTSAGTINATIPAGTTTGTGYRIRVVSSNPTVTGTDNGTNLTIINGTQDVSSFSAGSSNLSALLSWTNPAGCYNEILIVAKANSSITGTPSGDGSSYTGNLAFGSGTAFDGGYVLYKGTTSPQTVTNLTNGTIYYFKAFTRYGSTWSTGVETSTVPTEIQIGDYRTQGSGTWGTVSVWQKWNGTAWEDAAAEPDDATKNVTIRNGHTIELTVSLKDVKNLIIENGGKLYRNGTVNTFINLWDDIICNGTIGNGSTFDGISFNIEGTDCSISGTGTFDVSRIRKSASTNSTSNLTIGMNLNIRFGSSSQTQIYNNAAGTDLHITIAEGYTVDLTSDGTSVFGNISIDGIDGTDGGEKGGSVTVNGTLIVNGSIYMKTNNTTNTCSWIIGSTGLIRCNSFDAGESGTAGSKLTIQNGGKLEFMTSVGFNPFSSVNNIFNLNTGSKVEYSASGDQTIESGIPYSNLIISGSGIKSLNGNTIVSNTLALHGGLLSLGSNNLILDPAATISGTPDATKMVVATGTGQFRKQFSATGSFTFPVGDNTGTTEYSPVTLTFNDGTFGSNAYIGVRVINSKHPNNSSSIHYLNRYWEVTQSNITDPDYNIIFTYADGDINGTESAIYLGKYNGSFWILLDPANVSNNTISGSGIYDFSTFTGGQQEAMPVNLSAFNSSVTGRNIKLSWVTASEVNNRGFDIQRVKSSESGVMSWETIGFKEGKGNSNTTTNYTFEDRNLQSGKYKYRLKQIDHNGNFEYFELSGETEVGIPKKFELSQNYPNPFNPSTKINIDLPEDGKVEMRIYDMLGREAAVIMNEFRSAGYHTVTFNASNLSSGIYFYRIAAGKYTAIKKMLLIK